MPRFSEQEKTKIQQALLTEGEKLFTAHGMKKVTINDIVDAVNIAKATFYRFYEGKEYLFLDIAEKQQKEIFDILNTVLLKEQSMSDEEKLKGIFSEMFVLMTKYPMLAAIDQETLLLISRKVSPRRIEQYMEQGFDAVKTIEASGITFRYNSEIISSLFHALYEAWIKLQEKPEEIRKTVMDIMVDGIIRQII